jgi:hypothetical protein
MFEHVIAADISPGNLFRCGEWMEKKGIANVTTLLLTSPYQLGNIAHFDFLYSVIVLQHNAPPVQKILLDKLLPKINSDGCLFQTPDNLPNYSYSATDHLNSTLAVMDSHCLPKPVVLRLLHEHGLQVRDVQMDPWNGNWGSYTYFATR